MTEELFVYRLLFLWEGSSSGGSQELGLFASLERAMSIGKQRLFAASGTASSHEWRESHGRWWLAEKDNDTLLGSQYQIEAVGLQ